ncbi:hypothetical protein D3C72_2279940 [compost metagenome]
MILFRQGILLLLAALSFDDEPYFLRKQPEHIWPFSSSVEAFRGQSDHLRELYERLLKLIRC